MFVSGVLSPDVIACTPPAGYGFPEALSLNKTNVFFVCVVCFSPDVIACTPPAGYGFPEALSLNKTNAFLLRCLFLMFFWNLEWFCRPPFLECLMSFG